MAKYRWLAEWVVEPVYDENGDPDLYRDKHAVKDFPTKWDFKFEDNFGETDPVMLEAAQYGCEQNCFGSKCFVYLQRWAYDGQAFEDTGHKQYDWWDEEKYYCVDGAVVERVD